jgi:hypothetical protein
MLIFHPPGSQSTFFFQVCPVEASPSFFRNKSTTSNNIFFSEQIVPSTGPACSVGWWLMAGAGLF